MEELSLDNILGADEMEELFSSKEDLQEEDPVVKEDKEKDNTEEATETVDVDNLFTKESESVGSGTENKEEKEDVEPDEDGSSPTKHFYSSIAKALKGEDIFQTLTDEEAANVSTPEDFAKVFDKEIASRLSEKQRRIDEALNSDVDASDIRNYEKTLEYLDSIKEEDLKDESDKGEKLRKQLIYQDFINRGYKKERALREVDKSFNSGTDIEDAKEALASNKDYFNSEYESLIQEAKEEKEREIQERQAQAEKLKKSILEDNNLLGGVQIDRNLRQKAYDSISKPIYKNPETGELLTAVQKYEMENRTEFLKNIGLLFTLTDGFKNIDGLVKNKVRREVKKGLRELEENLTKASIPSDGNLRFISGVDSDPESFDSKGWSIDV